MVFAPMLDVARDPRGGRIAEGAGEDVWLTTRMAEAKVRGFQGDDPKAATSVAAVAKHLVADGLVNAGREYAQVDVSERRLHETYLPPFRAAVEAGVLALMPSFNDVAGVPMTANGAILRDLVRARWGFDGLMVSDYNAIPELMNHGVAGDLAAAATLALKAGVDIDMMGGAYTKGLPGALERGLVTMADIDACVRRVLRLKERLGLFEDPYREAAAPGLSGAVLQAHRALAREAARRSIVLLTNRGGLLPLQPAPARIAVLGPLADSREDMLGPWSGAGEVRDMVTLLEGLRAAFPDSRILHAPGVPVADKDASGLPAALAAARDADLVGLCLGEGRRMSGEAGSRAQPDLPGLQPELARAVLDLGKPVVLLLSSGRPVLASWLYERADATLACWFLGAEAGHAVADVLTGRQNPTGRLPVSWPVEVGQIPIHYDQLPTGRPFDPAFPYSSKYLDCPNDPLFPFGHGLSYSRFAYAGLRASPAELAAGDACTVEVEVTNEGPVAGEETVLLFVNDPVASLSRPVLELKGMTKLRLAAGERGVASFRLATADLAFVGPDLAPRLEPGAFDLYVGPTADRNRLLKTRIHLREGCHGRHRRAGVIRGRVQGVGFRAWTAYQADRLGLRGWVRNRRDGTVEAALFGPAEAVDEMLRRCHRGPRAAQVDDVATSPEPDQPPAGFEQRSTA